MKLFDVNTAGSAAAIKNVLEQTPQSFAQYSLSDNSYLINLNGQYINQMKEKLTRSLKFYLMFIFLEKALFQDYLQYFNNFKNQFNETNQIYDSWMQNIIHLIQIEEKNLAIAKQYYDNIQEFEMSIVTQEEFQQYNTQFALLSMDKEQQEREFFENIDKDVKRQSFKAWAENTVSFGQLNLQYLLIQKDLLFTDYTRKIQEFKNKILTNFFQQIEDRFQFINEIKLKQYDIFEQDLMSNYQDGLEQELYHIRDNFFETSEGFLYCLQFSQDLKRFGLLIENNNNICQKRIELAIVKAEEPHLISLKNYLEQKYTKALDKLEKLQIFDQVNQLEKNVQEVEIQFLKTKGGFASLGLKKEWEKITVLNDVTETNNNGVKVREFSYERIKYLTKLELLKEVPNYDEINPYDFHYGQAVRDQEIEVNKYKPLFEEVMKRLKRGEILEQELNECETFPQRLEVQFQQEMLNQDRFRIEQTQKYEEFISLLKLGIDSFQIKKQNMNAFQGALARRMVIRKNPCMMCCGDSLSIKNTKALYYDNYITALAAKFRQINGVGGSCIVSNEKRINLQEIIRLNQVPDIMMMPEFLACYRTFDGGIQKHILGVRQANILMTLYLTMYGICEVYVQQSKIEKNYNQQSAFEVLNQYNYIYTLIRKGDGGQQLLESGLKIELDNILLNQFIQQQEMQQQQQQQQQQQNNVNQSFKEQNIQMNRQD